VWDLQAEVYAKTLHIEKLKAQLAALRRARFGRSSEQLDRDIGQLELLLGDLEEGDAEATARAAKAGVEKPARGDKTAGAAGGRQPLPEHLPRQSLVHEPACVCRACGSTALRKIGEDRREVLEYVPSHFAVIVHVRPKLSCRVCEAITQAPMPLLPIERGRPGPGLIAHVLVAKYCDHLPLYRQSAIYGRAGVALERSTIADWVGGCAVLLEPLAQAITRHVRAGAALRSACAFEIRTEKPQ
jgi:transposase